MQALGGDQSAAPPIAANLTLDWVAVRDEPANGGARLDQPDRWGTTSLTNR